jgi:tRNA(Ser,Leu) C12 N-acetylase TAN1
MASLLLVGTPWVANAQNAAHLKGLTAVAVHVDPVESPTGTVNVSMTQLEADVQQPLRQAGITIVSG